jgi:hypothetical protein
MGRRVIAVLAGCAAVAVAPSAALAQGGFTDYRQAAADQYPTQPPQGDNGSGGNQQGGGDQQVGGSGGSPRPAGSGHHSGGNNAGKTNGSGTKPYTASGTAPVAVPTHAVAPAKGSLPFTGSDLSGLVVLALALIAAGFLLAAVERATRRRRAAA